MPFTKPKLFRLFFFSVFASLLFSCTGQDAKPPIDSEPILGKTEKAFYNTLSPISTNVVLTEGQSTPSKLVHIASGVVTSTTSVSPELVQLSLDGTILTIKGQPGIYEYSPVTVAAITGGSATPPAPTVESYCTNVAEAGFTELHVEAVNGTYGFTALTASQKTAVGGAGLIQKSEDNHFVSYNKGEFGTLQIDKTLPSPSDAAFFKADFQLIAPGAWQAVTSMYCHLNNATTTISRGLLSDTFSDADYTLITNHKTNAGQSWTLPGAGIEMILSNLLTIASSSPINQALAISDTGKSDFTLTVDLHLNVVDVNTIPAVFFRYTDSNNYWYFQINNPVGPAIILVEKTNGVITERATVYRFAFATGTNPVTITVNGASISASYTGSTLTYTSQSNQAATKIGLMVSGAPGDNAFGNLKIATP